NLMCNYLRHHLSKNPKLWRCRILVGTPPFDCIFKRNFIHFALRELAAGCARLLPAALLDQEDSSGASDARSGAPLPDVRPPTAGLLFCRGPVPIPTSVSPWSAGFLMLSTEAEGVLG